MRAQSMLLSCSINVTFGCYQPAPYKSKKQWTLKSEQKNRSQSKKIRNTVNLARTTKLAIMHLKKPTLHTTTIHIAPGCLKVTFTEHKWEHAIFTPGPHWTFVFLYLSFCILLCILYFWRHARGGCSFLPLASECPAPSQIQTTVKCVWY